MCAVCRDLKLTPFDYQRVPANPNPPRERVDRELTRSEIYLGILGGKHGTAYPPPAGRSVVEYEFETFYGQDGLRLTAVFPKTLPPGDIEPLQEKFRSRLSGFTSKVWTRNFDSTDKLRAEVRDAIQEWLVDTNYDRKKAEEKDVRRSLRTITLSAGILVAFAILIAIIFIALQPAVSTTTVCAMIACPLMGILICLLFVQFLL